MSLDIGSSAHLYRGVSLPMHVASRGRIAPKQQGPFEHEFTADSTLITVDNTSVTIGPSDRNAIHWHQLAQGHHPTSGISTTPHYERAVKYATWGGVPGVVYVINREGLDQCNVREFIVADHVPNPRVPEDDEVILVTPLGAPLPPSLIVRVLDVAA